MRIFILIIFILSLNSCKRDLIKDGILMAEREAPIGMNHLRIFKDSTFEFEYKSFMTRRKHKGKIHILHDTLYFNYLDSIPSFGNKAIINGRYIIFTDSKYQEKLEIWLDSISN